MAKRKLSVTIDSELVNWVEERIKEKRFANISHALEYALFKLKQEEYKSD
jgi:Arc/MetJ-type ribon-helix-helix transcriptional regulator